MEAGINRRRDLVLLTAFTLLLHAPFLTQPVQGDEVIVETADGSKAATVRGAEDDQFRYLLMPVRVS